MAEWKKRWKQIDKVLLSLSPSAAGSLRTDRPAAMVDLTRKIASSVLVGVEKVRQTLKKPVKTKPAAKIRPLAAKPVKVAKKISAKSKRRTVKVAKKSTGAKSRR